MDSSQLQKQTKNNDLHVLIIDTWLKTKNIQPVHKYRLKVSLQTPGPPTRDTPVHQRNFCIPPRNDLV